MTKKVKDAMRRLQNEVFLHRNESTSSGFFQFLWDMQILIDYVSEMSISLTQKKSRRSK